MLYGIDNEINSITRAIIIVEHCVIVYME